MLYQISIIFDLHAKSLASFTPLVSLFAGKNFAFDFTFYF